MRSNILHKKDIFDFRKTEKNWNYQKWKKDPVAFDSDVLKCKQFKASNIFHCRAEFSWSVFSCIRTEYGEILRIPYLSVFSPNVEKCGPRKLRIRTLFTQWSLLKNVEIYCCNDLILNCVVPSSHPKN